MRYIAREASGWLGHHVEQPRFAALASGARCSKTSTGSPQLLGSVPSLLPGGDEPVTAYSSLLAGFPSPDGQAQGTG